MYIYTTTTNCPLATQPPPDSTYHCSFDLSFKPDPVDIGFINRRCPSQIQTRWTFMKISQIGDFVYFFSQCRPLENQICTFKKPSIQGVYSSCHPNIFPQWTPIFFPIILDDKKHCGSYSGLKQSISYLKQSQTPNTNNFHSLPPSCSFSD